MHRHDGCCLWSDGSLDAVRVNVTCGWVNVNEHGLDAVPPQGVGGRYKAVRGGDDLARDSQRLKCRDEWKGAVGE